MLAIILNASVIRTVLSFCTQNLFPACFLGCKRISQENRVSKLETFTKQHKHGINAVDTRATLANLQMLKVNETVGKVDICTQAN